MLTIEEREQLEELDMYGIEDLFLSECDSWFSADIACCDLCVDDFLKAWPNAGNAIDFQSNVMDIDHFYESTRLRECYTPEDYLKFIQLVNCPRCGEQLKGGFYPYELPFMPVDSFEDILNELMEIAHKSPFVMLKHEFAESIFQAIQELAENAVPTEITQPLYRARAASQITEVVPKEFDVTPKAFASEGRYNHSGLPAFYLGSDMRTCYEEMRRVPCYMAEICVNQPVKILDLTATYENHEQHSDMLDTMVYSALVSAKHNDEGQYKPQYLFSRFVADCAKYAGFDAIKYPSTRTIAGCFNLVFLNQNFSLGNACELLNVKRYPDEN
ncbi:RES family NAD+ phosphorylase [Vibrio parahaemolyticus]|nr:RES family NAD+ phosphorylase [Vibrio parahaemolyticus]MBE3770412.1 RES family NAD+ phosphorylase [Vibrio parahaemolyticus]